MPREGILIRKPLERLTVDEIKNIHHASLDVLKDPGITCYNAKAAEIFKSAGASVERVEGSDNPCWNVSIPAEIVNEALRLAPREIKLGARDENNALIMKGDEPRVHLVSGSETNIWLDTDFKTYVSKENPDDEVELPVFNSKRGTVEDLAKSAHLAEQLETLDGFIRPVNIQDKEINNSNKDVNKFFASLNNTTKHVMAGLTSLEELENVVRMAELVAGGPDKFKNNHVISFITCLVKSPMQMVNDTTQTLIELCSRGLPLVVSSSPQAGTTAPPTEAGIIVQINAEVLAGITLSQLVNSGTPVLYGCVPVRARLDNLNDAYSAPETAFYNIDCVQLARYYQIPCYSTAGVSDAGEPGMQSAVERLFSSILVALSGPQYLHCAFGLLDGNSTFSMLQAVIDDAHYKMLRMFLQDVDINDNSIEQATGQIRQTVDTQQKLFINFIRPLMRRGKLSRPYPFEGKEGKDQVIELAYRELQNMLNKPESHLSDEVVSQIMKNVPGILPVLDSRK